MALLVPLIAFNREIGLFIYYTFVNRFYREKVLRQELHVAFFDDGLFTYCGFGFAVDSNLCQILFDSVVMNLDLLFFCSSMSYG
jgi:hypothetical protein